jgi:transposase
VQYSVDKRLYALRARIECFFNRLKNHRRIATHYDQTSTSFLGFVLPGCIRIWIRLSTRPSKTGVVCAC